MTHKPKHLRLVKDPAIELRKLATLWRLHARQQVEEELRRKGIKPAYVNLNALVRQWLEDHPRQQQQD